MNAVTDSGARDRGRAAVYAAELAAFDGTDLEQVRDREWITDLIGQVTTSAWWAGPTVRVVSARRGALSSATHGPVTLAATSVVIRLTEAQSTVATAAHELAHALAGVGHGHDAVFRRAYLDVVSVITNLDTTDRRSDLHVRQLTHAFDAAALRIGERAWAAPGGGSGRAIAL